MTETAAQRALAQPVFVDGANVPFGELTLDQVRARAGELRADVGWGPTARVAPVARAWAEFANAMAEAGAARVAELPAEVIEAQARRLWVLMP
jgi:hypothetical protein